MSSACQKYTHLNYICVQVHLFPVVFSEDQVPQLAFVQHVRGIGSGVCNFEQVWVPYIKFGFLFMNDGEAGMHADHTTHKKHTCGSSETTSVLLTPSFCNASHQLCANGRYAQLEDVITISPS